MKHQRTNGCEIHRIKEFDHYDEATFMKMYNSCKPLIRSLSKNVDSRRFNLSPDIIQSYFWDKFLYVFGKYKDVYNEERLKANLISSLKAYKNKLLRTAYNQQCQFNQDLVSFDELMDINGNREYLDDSEEVSYKEELSKKFHDYMRNKLDPDEYIIFTTELNPPDWIINKTESGRISLLALVDFFDLPRNMASRRKIANARKHIKEVLEQAKVELKA